jgi:carboxyl-terminal processing protease
MRGPVNTKIQLRISRKGIDKPVEVSITRDIIRVQPVPFRMEGEDVAYIRITQFNEQTTEGVRRAINDLTNQAGDKLKGIVLDLRNNPGGLLDQAISVSDAFLEKGEIVSTRGRNADETQRFNARAGDLTRGKPIIILINGGSASASEIVAGALQDHKRAVIMGTKSFGKGSVQTIIPVSNGAALKITTARYYTPSGRSIQASGIVPDIVTEEARITKSEAADRLREADLARHLENGDEIAKPKEEPKKEDKKDDKKKDETGKPAVEDYQLQEALNLLKGISFFKAQGK